MAINIERFRKDLNILTGLSRKLELSMLREAHGEKYMRKLAEDLTDEQFKSAMKNIVPFRTTYEGWYSESIFILKQLLPERVSDFKRHYERPKSRKEITHENYTIEDFMIGLEVRLGGDVQVDTKAAFPKLQSQTAILSAVERRFESSLFEMRQLVQADLFDSEIASARELLRHRFYRAAGAVAGVILEKHLLQVCSDHNISISKKNPGIGDLNEALKSAGTIEMPQWRHISLLADIRNICDHNKHKEPTEEQVADLINGTDKVLKSVA